MLDRKVAPLLAMTLIARIAGATGGMEGGEIRTMVLADKAAQVMQTVSDASLFSPSLGNNDVHQKLWENADQGQTRNLKQINVNVLQESDVIRTAESLDIVVRFPVFQVEKPVREWSYHFNLKDFKQAVRHTDDNCTPDKFMQLIDQAAIGASL